MDKGWSLFTGMREQYLFQYVAEGWIFTVGKRWSYLVNSTQQAALLLRITRINQWRATWIIPVAVLFAALVAETDRLSGPGFFGWVGWFLLVMIAGNAALLFYRGAMPYLQWLLLRPILAAAPTATSPPAPAPIGFWESVFAGSKDDARTFSTGWLVFASLLCGIVSLMYAYDVVASGRNYLMAALTIYLAMQSGGALFLKLKARRSLEPREN